MEHGLQGPRTVAGRGGSAREPSTCVFVYRVAEEQPSLGLKVRRVGGDTRIVGSKRQAGDRDTPRRERDPRDTRRIRELERENTRLREDRDRWKRRSEELQEQLDAARRAGRRQAAAFAKKRPQGRGGRPGRRAGTAYGQQGRRPCPARVAETHAAPAGACPDCGGVVDRIRVASQYQEDLPVVRPLVRRFDIEVGHCSQCGRRVQGRHPLQTSDALGAASVQLGPGVAGLAVHLHTELGVPLAKVARLLRNAFGLHVTPGGLAHLLHRVARDAAPLYGLPSGSVASGQPGYRTCWTASRPCAFR